MAMQAPMSAKDLEQVKKTRLEDKARNTHFCVWPDGRVTEHVLEPPEEGDDGNKTGDVPMAWINGEPAITKRYRKLGCRRLIDVCEDDGEQHKYEALREAVRARILGKPIRGDVGELYPATVHRLRELARVGGNASGEAYVIGEGLAPDPELNEEKLRSKLASAGLPPPPDKPAKPAKPDKPVKPGEGTSGQGGAPSSGGVS